MLTELFCTKLQVLGFVSYPSLVKMMMFAHFLGVDWHQLCPVLHFLGLFGHDVTSVVQNCFITWDQWDELLQQLLWANPTKVDVRYLYFYYNNIIK